MQRGRDHPSVTAPLLASDPPPKRTGTPDDYRPTRAASKEVIAVVRERSKPVCQPSSPNPPQGVDEGGDSQDVGAAGAPSPHQWGRVALAAARLQGARLQVYVAIAAHAGPDRSAFPGLDRLIDATGLGRRTVQRALRDLEAEGWLSTTPGTGHRGSFYVLRVPPEGGPQTASGAVPAPPEQNKEQISVPSEPPTAAPPAAPTHHGAPAMPSQPSEDQLGFDLGVEAPEPAPRPRKDGGPAARVVAAYCASYVAEHGRQPASERARVAGQAKTMLGQGHTEAELIEAADQLGRTRFTYLAEQVRMVRAQTRRVETAAVGGVEGWQGTGTDGTSSSGPSALDRVYG